MADFIKQLDDKTIHSYDELSGAYGAALFKELLISMVERAKRYEEALTVIGINYHIADDVVKIDKNSLIRGLGVLIQQSLRDADIFGRWNNTSFWIACPKSNIEQASKLCKRLDTNLNSSEVINRSEVFISQSTVQLDRDEKAINYIDRIEQQNGKIGPNSQKVSFYEKDSIKPIEHKQIEFSCVSKITD